MTCDFDWDAPLPQTLDLVTMEPKLAGELTAAEKYIIKSRLRLKFWQVRRTHL